MFVTRHRQTACLRGDCRSNNSSIRSHAMPPGRSSMDVRLPADDGALVLEALKAADEPRATTTPGRSGVRTRW
ncbi:MAG TPA: hypothetical protein VIX82_07915 [Solirubrobacteraceae bacterium]